MANNTIQGLNIAFGAETTEFDKGIKDVEKNLSASTKYAKELDKALKFDPTSVEKLEKSLEQNEKSLELAQKAADKYQTKLTSLSKVDIDKLTTEIEDTEKALKESQEQSAKLQEELKSISKTDVDPGSLEQLKKDLQSSQQESEQLKVSLKEQNTVLKQLDTQNMEKLAAQAQKAENKVSELEQEQKKLNNDINSLNTENYEELSYSTKKAAVSTGQLTKEQVGFGSAVKETDLSGYNKENQAASAITEQFGGAIGTATKFLNPYTAALALATAGIVSMYKATAEAKKFNLELATSMEQTSVSSEKLYAETKRLSTTFGVDYEQGVTATKNAINLYGSELGNTISVQDAWISSLALSTNEVFGYEQSLRTIRRAQYDWNASIEEGEALVLASTKAVNTYGTSADDLLDTYNEFYDTFAKAGGSAESFFDILIAGTILGARNTDEVANAINEVVLRTEAMTDATKQAYETIGISSHDAQQAIKNDDIAGLLLDIIDGLSGVENATAAAAEIAGTYGEEFLEPLSKSEEKVTELHQAIDQLTKREETLSKVNDKLAGSIHPVISALNLNEQQISELKESYDGTSASVLDYLANNDLLTPSLKNLNEYLNLSTYAQKNLNTAYKESSASLLPYLDNTTILADNMQVLLDKGIITLGQQEQLNEAMNEGALATYNYLTQNQLLSPVFTTLAEQMGLSQEQIQGITDKYTAGLIPLTDFLTTNNMLIQGLGGLGEALGLSGTALDDMKFAFEQSTKAGIAYLITNGLLGKTLDYVGTQLEATPEQMAVVNEAMKIASEQGRVSALAYLANAGALQFLADKGIIAQEQVDKLTTAQENLQVATDILTGSTTNVAAQLLEASKGYEGANKNSFEYKKSLDVLNESSKILSDTNTTAKEKLDAYNSTIKEASKFLRFNVEATDESRAAGEKLHENYKILSDSSSTTADKTDALTDSLKTLKSQGLDISDRSIQALSTSLDEYAIATAKSGDVTGDISTDIVNLGKKANISQDDVEAYLNAFKNSTTAFDVFKGNIKGAQASLSNLNGDLRTSTGYLNSFNSALAGANSGSSSFNPPSSANSFSANIPSIRTFTVPTSDDLQSNIQIPSAKAVNTNNKNINVAELKVEIKEAIPNAKEFVNKLRYEIGRSLNG